MRSDALRLVRRATSLLVTSLDALATHAAAKVYGAKVSTKDASAALATAEADATTYDTLHVTAQSGSLHAAASAAPSAATSSSAEPPPLAQCEVSRDAPDGAPECEHTSGEAGVRCDTARRTRARAALATARARHLRFADRLSWQPRWELYSGPYHLSARGSALLACSVYAQMAKLPCGRGPCPQVDLVAPVDLVTPSTTPSSPLHPSAEADSWPPETNLSAMLLPFNATRAAHFCRPFVLHAMGASLDDTALNNLETGLFHDRPERWWMV